MISERSAKLYCSEDITLIENYEKAISDYTQTWCIHHRNEINLQKSAKELMDMRLYYNRPADELIFLTNSEHRSLHLKNTSDEIKLKFAKAFEGKHHSAESRAKISAYQKGKYVVKDTCIKIAKALKGHIVSEETRKKLSKTRPKYRWLTPDNAIVLMTKANAACWHPDYKLLSNIPVDPNEKV